MDLGDLLSAAADLGSLVVDSLDHVFVEARLKTLLLLPQLFGLLAVLFQTALQIVNLGLILVP